MPTRRPVSRRPAYRARIDGHPRRPWSSVNVRRGDKRRFDLLVWAWREVHGDELTQWDAFSILLEEHLRAHGHKLPRGVREEIGRIAPAEEPAP